MRSLSLNNNVEMPALGFGVFQTPPDETRASVEGALSTGYRHIDTAAAYGNERQVGEAIHSSGVARDRCSSRPRSGSATTATTRRCTVSRRAPRKLGVDQIDLLILHQALPSAFDKTLEAYRALETLLDDGKVRAIGVSNFMVEHLDHASGEGGRRTGGQPDRGAPVLPAAGGPGVRHRARHPDPGVVADRWHHVLPRQQAPEHARRPGDRQARRDPRQDPGADHAALAPSGRSLRHPQVDQAAPHRRELRRVRLRAERRRAGRDRRPGHRSAWGTGPGDITLEAFGRPIPED